MVASGFEAVQNNQEALCGTNEVKYLNANKHEDAWDFIVWLRKQEKLMRSLPKQVDLRPWIF